MWGGITIPQPQQPMDLARAQSLAAKLSGLGWTPQAQQLTQASPTQNTISPQLQNWRTAYANQTQAPPPVDNFGTSRDTTTQQPSPAAVPPPGGLANQQAQNWQAAAANPIPSSGMMPGNSGMYTDIGGFNEQYLPGALGNLFDMPGLALQDVLRNKRGMADPLNSGLYYQLEPYADVANEALLMMQPNNWVTPEQAANFLGQFFGNLQTQGGKLPSFQGMMGSLTGAVPGAGTPLSTFLGVADPQEQVRNFMSLGRAAGAMGLHPYYADAFNALMAQAGNAYMSDITKGNYTGGFSPYFGQNYNPF